MEASMWMMQSVNDSEKSLSDITSQLCGLYKLKGPEECENFAREQVRRSALYYNRLTGFKTFRMLLVYCNTSSE